MTKTELIRAIAEKQSQFTITDIDLVVNCMIEHMAKALIAGQRIEIRGFGNFTLHKRPSRTGRNPKTGKSVLLPVRHTPHFKAGKELRERVNATDEKPPITD